MRYTAGLLAGLLSICALPGSSRSSTRSDFVVTTAADDGAGSLRQAILGANASLGPDTIRFAISGAAPHIVVVASDLPAITEAVSVDGTTQPGFVDMPIVELRGGEGTHVGLDVSGGFSVVRGLAIDGFETAGIRLREKGYNAIEGCFVGTDTSGVDGAGNNFSGIDVESSPFCRIGGTTPAAANVISRNGGAPDRGGGVYLVGSTDTVVQGNFIGTDRTATQHIGNFGAGVRTSGSTPTVVGGAEPGAGNVIAYNGGPGISTHVLSRVVVLSNAIFENGALVLNADGQYGIHFDTAGILPAPLVTFVGAEGGGTRVTGGSLAPGFAGSAARVELFAADGRNELGFGQGERLLGSVEGAYDASGLLEFSTTIPVALGANELIVATATAGDFGSSAFSPSRGDTGGCTLPFVTGITGRSSVRRGESLTLHSSTTGTAPLTLQWYGPDGTPISGATTGTLTTPPVSNFDGFEIRATNACGSDRAGVSIVTCDAAPTVSMQPQGTSVSRGNITSFTVSVSSQDFVFFEWYRGSSGDTSDPVPWHGDTYVTPPIDARTSYWVRVYNGCGAVDSATATVDVFDPIEITSVKVKREASGAPRLVAKGRNLGMNVGVYVDAFGNGDYVGFVSPAKSKGSKVTQGGDLQNGRSFDEMLAPGRHVRLFFGAGTSGSAIVDYTRP